MEMLDRGDSGSENSPNRDETEADKGREGKKGKYENLDSGHRTFGPPMCFSPLQLEDREVYQSV